MLGKLDTWLTEHPKRKDLHGWRRFIVEFWFFGLKEARACFHCYVSYSENRLAGNFAL